MTVSSRVTLSLVVTVTGSSAITNIAEVTATNETDSDSTPDNHDENEDDQDEVTITPQQPDVELTKVVDNSTPNIGEQITYTVVVSNVGSGTATGVVVSDVLPSGLTYDSHTASNGNANYIDTTGRWFIATVAPSARYTLSLVVTVTGSSAITNIAEVTATNETDSDSTPDNHDENEDDQDEVTITPQQPDVELTKVVDNSTPNIGEQITYTVVVSNVGSGTATGVVVSDVLPSGLTYDSHTDTAGTTYTSGTGEWNIGSLTASGRVTLSLVVTVTGSSAITNIAEVTATNETDSDSTPDNHDENEDDQDEVTITPQQPDVELTKVVDNSTPNIGEQITYTVVVSNVGSGTATGVVVSDVLPSGLTYDSHTDTAGTTYTSGTGEWDIGSLTVSSRVTLSLVVTVTGSSAITNIAEVTATNETDSDSTPDNHDENEDDQDEVTITPQQPDVELTKVVDNSTPNIGEQITYTVVVSNVGSGTATGVVVSDVLPSGLTYDSHTDTAGTTYTSGTGEWDIGSLTVSSRVTLSLVVTVTGSSAITNIAEVTATNETDSDSTPDNHDENEDDQDEVTITPQQPDVELTKVVDNSTPNIGEQITYTVVVSNVGSGTATGVVVSDVLPSGLTYDSHTDSRGNTTYIDTVQVEWNHCDSLLRFGSSIR